MKPANFKSRLVKRLIPVLLVPVVLSSNFAAIYATADDEPVIEENPINQTIEPEVTSSGEPTNGDETVPEEVGGSDEQSGLEKTGEQGVPEPVIDENGNVIVPSGPEEPLGDVEVTEEVEEEVEGEEAEEEEVEEETKTIGLRSFRLLNAQPKVAQYVSFTLSGDSVAEEGITVYFEDDSKDDEKVKLTYGETNSVFAGYEGDSHPEVKIRINENKNYHLKDVTIDDTSYGKDDKIKLKDIDLEATHTIKIEASKDDTKNPEIDYVCLDGEVKSVGGLEFIPVTEVSGPVLKVGAKDVDESDKVPASGVSKVEVEINGKTVSLTKVEDKDEYIWSPKEGAYGVYEIGKITVTDKCNNSISKYLSDFELKNAVCYYDPSANLNLRMDKASKASGQWYNIADSMNNKGEYKLVFKGYSVSPVEEISAKSIGAHTVSTKLNCEYKSNEHAFYVEAEFDVNKAQDNILGNGVTEFEFFAKRLGDQGSKKIGSHTVKIDLTVMNESPLSPDINEKNRTAKFTVHPQWDDPSESGLKTATVSYKYKGQRVKITKHRIFILAWETEEIENFEESFNDIVVNFDNWNPDEYSDGTITFTCNLENFKTDKNTIVSGKYEIQSVKLVDVAGNEYTNECINENQPWDQFKPVIGYHYDIGDYITYNDIFFTNNSISGDVSIYDTDLNDNEVKFSPLQLLSESGVMGSVPEGLNAKNYDVQQAENSPVKKYTYNFTMGEGGYYFDTYAKDKEGNDNNEQSYKFVVDKTAPVVEVKYNGQTTPKTYYNAKDGSVDVTVSVSEKWMNFEKSYVEVIGITEDGSDGTIKSSDIYSASDNNGWSGKFGEDSHELTINVSVDGIYHVKYHVEDLTNSPVEGEIDFEFTLDTKSPEVLTYEFAGPEARNDKYYNDTRTLTVVVKDLTFDVESAAEIKEEYGTATDSAWVETAAYTFTKTIEFKEDGIYSFILNIKDLAGNDPVVREESEFYIDKTAPKINVYYDNNDARNGFYYKDARVATVDIEDLSFSGDKVFVFQTASENAGSLPSLGSFSASGLKNAAQMYFEEDGSYGYIVDCEDLAGNRAETYTADMFVIDRTIPEVEFSGVENYSANNGTVAPSVSYVDRYMDIDASYVTLTGSNNGAVELANTVNTTENGFVISYSDFEHVKGMDDLYILKAHVMDLAGNENEDELVFSVNRFGSVFVLGDATKLLNEEYYTREPIDVTITEINVDELTQKTVSISRDGDIKELRNGRQYKVTQQGSDTSWKTYTYTVSKDNFSKDGIYSVTVYTKDRATNVQDNKSRDAEINFAVDMTAPSVVTAGIKSGDVYKEASHTVNIDVTDNMGVTSLTVFKDGQEIETYDDEQLTADGGVESITLTESESRQALRFVAQDVAGNVTTVEIDNILVSTKDPVENDDNNDNNDDSDDDSNVRGAKRERNAAGFIIVALGVCAAGAGGGLTAFKKKMKTASKD